MRKLRYKSSGLALLAALLIPVALWAQDEEPTYPEGPTFDGNFELPDVSGVFNPMRVSTQDVQYAGGSVDIPFTLNQRGTVWLAIYETGNTETGATGPGDAVLRLQAQDKFVAVTAGQAFESGSNTISWDGTDADGNDAGAGTYAFDIIAVNNLDKPALAGPSAFTGFTQNLVNTRSNPPEMWVEEFERENAALGGALGDVIRGDLGTDYIANPNAWERWSYRSVVDFEGARTLGGWNIDDQDQDVFWTTHNSGENGGLYKMTINRAAQEFDADLSFGDNGFSANRSDRVMGIEPWGNVVYVAHWDRGDVPFCSIESRDKTTGETIATSEDLTEFYHRVNVDDEGNETVQSDGPSQLGVSPAGVWMTTHWQANITMINHDGEIMWVNRNGDLWGDTISNEEAALLGHARGHRGSNMQIEPDNSGNIVMFTQSGNTRGAQIQVLGRDGTGLFDIFMASSLGPWRPDRTWFLTIHDEDGGDYDGIYKGTQWRLDKQNGDEGDWTADEGTPWGAAATFFIPYELQSGILSADSPTAVSEIDSDIVPESYSLDSAYPNPFNPQTTIEFTVPARTDALVKVDVYNSAGQFVASLVDDNLAPGAYRTTWDGRDAQGQEVSSGVYMYRMTAGTYSATHSVTFLK